MSYTITFSNAMSIEVMGEDFLVLTCFCGFRARY